MTAAPLWVCGGVLELGGSETSRVMSALPGMLEGRWSERRVTLSRGLLWRGIVMLEGRRLLRERRSEC